MNNSPIDTYKERLDQILNSLLLHHEKGEDVIPELNQLEVVAIDLVIGELQSLYSKTDEFYDPESPGRTRSAVYHGTIYARITELENKRKELT